MTVQLDAPEATQATEKIPVFVPAIDADTLAHVGAAFDAKWLGMGALTKEFEERIAAFLETDRYVVATSTGTAALHIALMAAGIGEGDEVITPSFNYVADHQAIRMAGATVVMCDIREDDLGIDCEKAEALISPRTKAIMPLHFAGVPCDQAGVYALARKHGLRVIEDGTHSFGSTVDGKKIGSYGDVSCFSFDPVKIMTSIDGGCVVLQSSEEFERLCHLRLLGVDKDTTVRYKNARSWEYDVVGPGYRYHMTNIIASIGISQIKKIDALIATRQEVCARYSRAFLPVPGLRPMRRDFSDVSPFIYSIRVLDGRRGSLIDHLRSRNIDAGIHFGPVHRHTYFSDAKRSDMSVTDRIAEEVLTLPLHSHMPEAFVQRVIEGVISFFR